MKTTLFAAALLIACVPAGAGQPSVAGLITCWYNQNGKLTGATPAQSGAKPGTTIQTAAGGDRAWSRIVVGGDSSACPDKLPVSSLATQ